jgi:DNA-binding NarL/FixJ family response regulator
MGAFGFTQIIEATSADEAIECLSKRADIKAALLHTPAQGMQGVSILRAVRQQYPNTRLVALSGGGTRHEILAALEAGVHGYISKRLSISDLTAALNVIISGGIYVPPSLADISASAAYTAGNELQANTIPVDLTQTGEPLTPRQRGVLDLLVQGKTNKEIALALGLSEGTVKIHMAAIFRYFGVNTRTAAAVAGASVLDPQVSRSYQTIKY